MSISVTRLMLPVNSASFNSKATDSFKASISASTSLAADQSRWDCMKCLKASQQCGFCADGTDKLLPGACLTSNVDTKNECHSDRRAWYTRGCPRKFGWIALIGLGLYIIFFSPGMGIVPWVVNSEIYPLRYRGVYGGIASTTVRVSNLIVTQILLTLTEAIRTAWTFMLFGCVDVVAIIFVLIFVPETKGVVMEEVENMFNQRAVHLMFWQKEPAATKVYEGV